MSKIKVGIIGTGNISQVHIDGYLSNPDVELYAFCDINEERLKQKGEKYGVTRLFTDKNEMLKLKEIDAVSVCTWNAAHAECTIAALNAGKHVICEKPMAMNAIEAQKMQDAAEKNGKILMIGFVRRHGNDCYLLKDFIDNGEFGEIYFAKARYLRRNGCPGSWFGNKALSGGGPLIDLGVHVIDLVKYLAGNHKPISAYGATFQKLFNRPDVKDTAAMLTSDKKTSNDVFDVEDLATALIRFDNGFVISVEASFSLNIKNDIGEIELFGTKAGAKIDSSFEIYSTTNGYMSNIQLNSKAATDFGDLFVNEMNHFVSCIKGETKCIAPAEDGVSMMKILDAIYESARTGHEVIIK